MKSYFADPQDAGRWRYHTMSLSLPLVVACLLAQPRAAAASEEMPSDAPFGDGEAGRIAILGDMPGTDRPALERLAQTLRSTGFGVTFLSGEQVCRTNVLERDRLFLYIVPNARVYPADGADALAGYLKAGGHLMTQGGPAFSDPAWRRDGRWLTPSMARALNATTQPERVVFDFEDGSDLDGWSREANDPRVPGGGAIATGGARGSARCLNISTDNLTGREVFRSPQRPALFPHGHGLLCFHARGDAATSQFLVEVSEADGSKWVATVNIGTAWTNIVLAAQDFRYRPSRQATGHKNGADVPFDLGKAVQVSFGLSVWDNIALGRGPHSFRVDRVGSARDPYPEAAKQRFALPFALETITPSHKVYPLDGIASLRAAPDQWIARSADRLALPAGGIATTARSTGPGFGHRRPWRWLPLVEAIGAKGERKGALVSMLLNNAPPIRGTILASLGFGDPALLGDKGWSALVARMALAMRRGVFLVEAGSSEFSYWPDEPFELGAHVTNLNDEAASVSVVISVREADGGETMIEKTEDISIQPGEAGTVQTQWQPRRHAASRYLVRTELRQAGGLIDVIHHEVGMLETGNPDSDNFVTVKGSDFYLQGKKWYPVGVNYRPLYRQGGWLGSSGYDPNLIEEDMVRLKALGINMVSIMKGGGQTLRNFLDFLRRCERRDIKVFVFLGTTSPLDFKEAKVKDLIETGRLAENPAIFAYDIIWEPGNSVFGSDERRGRWDGAWRAWLDERYGGVENAERDWNHPAPRRDGLVVSPSNVQLLDDGPWRVMAAAYRRFMDDVMSPKWQRAVRRLKEIDPNHLVSFRQGNTRPLDFTLTATPKHTDFVSPEGYSFEPSRKHFEAAGFINRYIHFTSGGKPILWSEFGKSIWDPVAMRPDPHAMAHQADYHERFYRMVLESGANGTAPWWWPGGYKARENSDYGIVNLDGSFRPAAKLIAEYAQALKTPRDYPASDFWLTIDRDNHCSGYWGVAFNEGHKAYGEARAQGKNLGIRTAGTGTTSANTPLLAIGNTPLTAGKPPKYLNAEFNWLRIRDANGLWVDVTGKTNVMVRGDEPVLARVSVGNVQESEWLAPLTNEDRAAGRVYLSSCADSELALRRGLPSNTPWLRDSDFGEFVLANGIARPTSVVLQMNVEGLLAGQAEESVWFGEKARFTLIPKTETTPAKGAALGSLRGPDPDALSPEGFPRRLVP